MTGAEKIIEAVGEGIVDREVLAKRAGLTEGSLSATLSKLVLTGRLHAEKLNARNYDWATLRVASKRAEAKRDSAPRSAPKRSGTPRPTAPAASAPTPAAHAAGDGLEDCTSVTYRPEEIAAFVELEATLTMALAKVREVVNALQASPNLGPKGAAAMRLIATLMAEAK